MDRRNPIGEKLLDIALRHGGDSDEARLAVDHLIMDHGPNAVIAAGEQIVKDLSGE